MNKTFAKKLKEHIVDKKNTWMFVVSNKDKHSKYMDFGVYPKITLFCKKFVILINQ